MVIDGDNILDNNDDIDRKVGDECRATFIVDDLILFMSKIQINNQNR